VPTDNSITLWRKLVNADVNLHLYPDSGHGFLDQYHEQFSKLVNDFLDEPKAWAERP
jgi:dipeptidyl aminopeptidase/acylaminoacyl peptidase